MQIEPPAGLQGAPYGGEQMPATRDPEHAPRNRRRRRRRSRRGVRGAKILDRGALEAQVRRANARGSRDGEVDEGLRKIDARVAADAFVDFRRQQSVPAGEIHEVVAGSEPHQWHELHQSASSMHAIEAFRILAAVQGARVIRS